ncbi:MAG: hypothetical protein JW388_0975 [Nitrospira sp.]|nr:hypothetical protein [Nitrospira sp.]
MPLTLDLSGISGYKKVCLDSDEQILPVTKALIFATLSIGIGEWTVGNIKEVRFRLAFVSLIHGKPISALSSDCQSIEERDFTKEEVEGHIGLRTNVSKDTRNQFIKRHVLGFDRDWHWKDNAREGDI